MFDWQAELASSPIKLGIPAIPVPPPVTRTAPPTAPQVVAAPKPSFAQALQGKSALSDPLPVPSIRGDMLSVKITDDVYARGLDFCKTNLRGRLVFNKGDKPLSSKDLADRLQKVWKVKGPWHLTSLGRGFYEFFFNSQDDMKTVWAAGTVSLKPGLLRLFDWKKDFNMHTHRQTHTQVWVRLWELPEEYWMERTLYEIAGAVGTPLLIDNVTRNRLYGHYARILVDLDLSKDLFYEIMVEREGFAFPLAIEYEGLPDFCKHCSSIGHDVSKCRWLHPRKDDSSNNDKERVIVRKGKEQVPTKTNAWIPLKDNPSGTGSSKAFEAPPVLETPPVQQLVTHSLPEQAAQKVTVEVPQRLPSVEPILTLVTVESQEPVILPQRNSPAQVADSSLLHVEVEEEQMGNAVETGSLDTHAATDVVDTTDREVAPPEQIADVFDADMEGGNMPVIVREEGMTHSNARIQHDLDLWQKIKEYDRRAAETPFVPVLSKKQQQMLKKHKFDGKAPYKTRSTG
jgi:hypothetical protein